MRKGLTTGSQRGPKGSWDYNSGSIEVSGGQTLLQCLHTRSHHTCSPGPCTSSTSCRPCQSPILRLLQPHLILSLCEWREWQTKRTPPLRVLWPSPEAALRGLLDSLSPRTLTLGNPHFWQHSALAGRTHNSPASAS